MVFWLKKRWKDIAFLFLLTCIVMLPYITKDFLGIEHDTFFHVSRIEHLAEAIQQGNLLPAIYPTENNGFGYASPLFYCDFLLIPFALLHVIGLAISTTYKVTVFTATFLSACTMFLLCKEMTKQKAAPYLASTAYLFSNYRITDTYVRGALGEIFAFVFLPLILLGTYRILKENKKSFTLTIGLTGLALSHNLTFLMGCFLFLILCILFYTTITKKKGAFLCINVGLAFLFSAFFTLPMLEQLHSQSFIVDYYAQSSDLASGSMKLWQYFVNKTIFGYSGNTLDAASTMTVNIGWFLTFTPISYLFVKQKNSWVTTYLILGYITMLLPSSFVPYSILPLQIMQFPWRFNTIAMTLLCIPASIGITELCTKKAAKISILCVLCLECLYHIFPVYGRTFGLTSQTTWQDVLDGKIVDPYYSAYYVRVELAGGDYLPINSPDFRTLTKQITQSNGTPTTISYTEDYNALIIDTHTISEDMDIILPKTWYLGYHLYDENHNEIKIQASQTSLMQAHVQKDHIYTLTYQSTPMRKICISVSLLSSVIFCVFYFRKKYKTNKCYKIS